MPLSFHQKTLPLRRELGGEGSSQHWPSGSRSRFFASSKLRDLAKEIIRSPKLSDGAPSVHRDGISHSFCPEAQRNFEHHSQPLPLHQVFPWRRKHGFVTTSSACNRQGPPCLSLPLESGLMGHCSLLLGRWEKKAARGCVGISPRASQWGAG